jgi:FkbM family methyltransferase
LQGFGTGGLILPIFIGAAMHIKKLISDKEYRNCAFLESKLGSVPRYTATRIDIHGWRLSLADAASFLSAYREIFVDRIYAFKFAGNAPRILDLGANIGLSVLYFKRLFPDAQITAFEADPYIFGYLEKNVHGNGFTDVLLINKAAWHENATLKFSSDCADGGRTALAGDENFIETDAIDMKEFLKSRQFDFLKMDIEGAEEFVLPACRDLLANLQYVFIEYHSRAGQKQCLDRIVSQLAEAGFRIHVYSLHYSPSPLMEVKATSGFDLQLNIFGWKE